MLSREEIPAAHPGDLSYPEELAKYQKEEEEMELSRAEAEARAEGQQLATSQVWNCLHFFKWGNLAA